jgi:hypothetical protein
MTHPENCTLVAPLAPGEMYLSSVEVVEYLKTDGTRGYRILAGGDNAIGTVLKLLIMAEHKVSSQLEWCE